MFERCLYFNTNALARKLNTRWETAFARFNVSPAHGYMLRLILEKPGLSQQEIANELQLEKSTIARFAAHLEKKGLLERRMAENSSRNKAVFASLKTQEIQNELDALGEELFNTMSAAIGRENIGAFVKSIRDVTNRL
jgi:DNA-binding MarR family transcriptional regulator